MNMNKPNLTTIDRVVTVAVDVQNDFCPGGALGVNKGDEIVSPLNDVIALTRRIGGQVIATRDWHPSQTPHFNDWPIQDEAGLWPRHCVAGTQGAEFHTLLDIQPGDTIINKGTGRADGYSGFEGKTENGQTIEQIIQPRAAQERVAVFIGGLATDYCVRATVLDAARQARRAADNKQGYIEVYALTDAMRAVNLEVDDDIKALAEMESVGARLILTKDVGVQLGVDL